MGSWMFDEDDYYTDDGSDGEVEEYSAEDALMDKYEDEMQKLLEKRSFENTPKHGKFAHAYDHSIDNVRIMQQREMGKSLREIAELFSCSPSTIRNRLQKMGLK